MNTGRTGKLTGWRMLFSFLVILALITVFASAAAETHSHDGWTAWGDDAEEKNKLPTETGSYYLAADVTLPAEQTIASGREVTLCLNGRSVTVTGAVTGIRINGGTLNLYDCGTEEHRYSISNGLAVTGSGDKSFTGGYITHTQGKQGMAVDNNGGTFNLYSGTIIGNQTGTYTGTVNIQSGTFNMYGGRIAGNKSVADPREGSAVFNRGTFNLFDGTICDNTSVGYGGGIGNKKILNMSGGYVRDNHCSRSGAGIYSYLGTVTITGGTVSGNITDSWGGGVYLDEATLVLKGGEITGNKAKTSGGVHIAPDSSCIMTGGKVTNNTAREVGGVCNNGKMTLTGGIITGNSAPKYGGGIAHDCYATLHISGNPQVTGNTNGTNPSNVEMYNDGIDACATVSGDLSGAAIGVSMLNYPVAGTPYLIGKDYRKFNEPYPDTFFTSDNPDYDVILQGEDVMLAAKCSLAYNANGGSGNPPEGGKFVHGSKITVPGEGGLKLAGYSLAGWSRNPEGRRRGTADEDTGFYTPGDSFTITGNVTLYAQWEEGITVTWKDGDGSVLDRKIRKEGEPMPATDRIPVKAPDEKYTYTFSGWNDPVTDEDGNITFTPKFDAKEKPSEADPGAVPGRTPDSGTDPAPVDKPLPDTGDDGMPYLWSWMIILSACVAGLLIVKYAGAGRK